MSIDYDALLLDPNYEVHGIAARFVSRDGLHVDLVVIDKTAGAEHGSMPVLQGAKPAVCVRVSEIEAKGLNRDAMRKGQLSFADATWRVDSTLPQPVPGGKGEMLLSLTEWADG